MGFLSGLAKVAGFGLAPFTGGASIPIGQAVGGALDAAGQSMAGNRGTALDAALQGQQVANQTDQQNINARQNAWKDLLHSDYILNNNQGYQPATMHSSVPGMGDRTLPTFGIARKPFGSGMVNSAMGIQNELMNRLQNGPQLHAPDVAKMSKPSMWEKILGIAGPAATALGSFKFGGGGGGGISDSGGNYLGE